jgi:predicted transcriptional regulator
VEGEKKAQDSGAFGGTTESFGFGSDDPRVGTCRPLEPIRSAIRRTDALLLDRAYRREIERREFWKSIVQKACADAAAMGRVPGDEVKQAADLALRIFDETWGLEFTLKDRSAP